MLLILVVSFNMSRPGRPEDAGSDLTTEQILKTREVPWESFTSLRLISDRDVQLIRKYDKRKRETQAELLEQVGSFWSSTPTTPAAQPRDDIALTTCYLQNGPAYCEAFLNVLRNVTKEEAVQYVLALIDDMLSGTSLAHAKP